MIVIGVDGSDAAKEALQYGLHEASMRGTRVRAVHAWMPPRTISSAGPGVITPIDPAEHGATAAALLRSIVEAVAGDGAAQIDRVVVESPAGRAIIESAHDAELIVVGRRGISAMRSLVLGSVSSYVVAHARCPVLVVPAPHDRS